MPAPGVDQAQGPRGLSLLVQQVLGKPLDKSQQLSNWDRRPLAEGQLLYAGTCPARPAPRPRAPWREAKAAPAPSCRCLLPAGGVLGAVPGARPLPPGGGPGQEPEAWTLREAGGSGAARPTPAGDGDGVPPPHSWVLVRVEARGGGAPGGGPGFLHPESRSPEHGQFPGGVPAPPDTGLVSLAPTRSRAASGCALLPEPHFRAHGTPRDRAGSSRDLVWVTIILCFLHRAHCSRFSLQIFFFLKRPAQPVWLSG